jgi:hypothetical protein
MLLWVWLCDLSFGVLVLLMLLRQGRLRAAAAVLR